MLQVKRKNWKKKKNENWENTFLLIIHSLLELQYLLLSQIYKIPPVTFIICRLADV